jgi:hypothetical protein
MTEKKHTEKTESEQESLKRPEDEVKDIEPAPEDADSVVGGVNDPEKFYIK